METSRYIKKTIRDCRQCDFFCDEGEFCRHESWDKETPHVVTKDWDTYSVPDDCPLPYLKED